MRLALLALALATVAALPAPALASGCYVLSGDAKNLCLARERADRSMCYAIQSSSMRSLCLAEVGSAG